MAKVELKSAYRQVPLSQRSQSVAGLCWRFEGDNHDTYLVDTRLPFGASLSVGIFHRVTQSVCRILRRMGIEAIICFIDDFFISANNIADARRAMQLLIHTLVSLGFAISWDKCVSPTTRLTFLGVTIDTAAGTLSIPMDKLTEVKTAVSEWTCLCSKVTKRELQSLIGKLSWIARIIHAIRPCLRRFIDKMSALKRPSHRTRLTADLRRDLQMLYALCSNFNGTSFFLDRIEPETAYIVSDSSVTGAGAALVHRNAIADWLYIHWATDAPALANAHINIKELAIILLAIERWGTLWRNSKIIVRTDNKAALYAINKGSIRNTCASDILRTLRILCATRNLRLIAVYINTRANLLADSLSRLDHLQTATYALARINLSAPLLHMSSNAFRYLLQQWHSKKRNWTWNGGHTNTPH